MSLIRALVECGVAPSTIEAELHRFDGPRLQRVNPAFDIINRLPAGICSQLFAVPIGLAVDSATVEVAVVDLADNHAQQELAYHCGKPVRLVHAEQFAIEEALERIQRHMIPSQPYRPRGRLFTPAFGSAAARMDLHVVKAPSEKPIPLVRLTSPPSSEALLSTGPTRPTRGQRPSIPISVPPVREVPTRYDTIEPAPLTPAWDDAQIRIASPAPYVVEGPELLRTIVDSYETAVDELAEATCRDEVVVAVMHCMQAVAASAAVLTVRRDSFGGWACSPSLGTQREFRGLRIDRFTGTSFDIAADQGTYFGPLLEPELRHPHVAFWELALETVSITAVQLQNRPVLLIFLAQLVDPMIATLTAERIAKASAKALVRVLQADKRKGR